jgi:pyridoxamine 5'-phosphate oxidase
MEKPTQVSVRDLRISYDLGVLTNDMLSQNPFDQFGEWFAQAAESQILEANAMVVSTVGLDSQGNTRPASRTVLLKDFSESGFSFYTNLDSAKSLDIAANPNVTLLFPWYELHRQVIISGQAHLVPRDLVEEYFHSRPRQSQLGAWSSQQSVRLESREVLDSQYAEYELRFAEHEVIPVPEFWGGWQVVPTRIEFWQGRESRLHDRFVYELADDSNWQATRLSP